MERILDFVNGDSVLALAIALIHALMSAPSMLKGAIMLSNPQFLVAGQILTGLMCGKHPRESGECAKEVSYALEASAELIRQWQGLSVPTLDYKPPTPTGAARTREALVDRAFVATEQWRRDRMPKATRAPSPGNSGPALH